ncbi:MAG: RNA polymerase factor sigma-54 [Eubacteriales bacterium]|nr:RNA polymerase factor sigma-54 [Eubacteriales bacterium]
MKLGYELTIEQTQRLVMTPELIQAIQILQFNTQELDNYVQDQLLANPILEKPEKSEEPEYPEERGIAEEIPLPREEEPYEKSNEDHEIDWIEQLREREYDDISYSQWQQTAEKSDYTYEQFVSADITLSDYLMMQLQLAVMKPRCKEVAKYLIEALDENGYLTGSIEEVAKLFGISEERVMEALKIIQGFEPVGIGARDLPECLMIQMAFYGDDTEQTKKIIENHLEDIAGNRLGVIAKAVGISVNEVQEISDIIRTLEPKPGRQFGSANDNRYIIPDVTVEKIGEEYVVTVNDATAPRLNISHYYQKMLIESDKDSTISKYLTGRLNSAMWLIKSIEQRRQTIFNVVSAVVRYQVNFFEHGSKCLKTLTLKQIADELGIHESTVSRSVNGKYMQTPRGLFEIKFFFTSGVSGSDGLGIASESVKTFIREIIDAENPKSPYSDQHIAELLSGRGIEISRRTVAKYRDEMNLPSSSKRKRY